MPPKKTVVELKMQTVGWSDSSRERCNVNPKWGWVTAGGGGMMKGCLGPSHLKWRAETNSLLWQWQLKKGTLLFICMQ